MHSCSFELNNQPMSAFRVSALSVPAFSGQGPDVNRRSSACVPGRGPIPPGQYYIFDRQGGGKLEWIKNLFGDRGDWFALYAIDGKLDDETYCDQLLRGQFRLHPKGPRGISEGCITIDNLSDFYRVRALLKSRPPTTVDGSTLKAYRQVTVK